LSILLEVFGHIFISVAATFGYFIYYCEPKFIIFGIMMSGWSDTGGLMFGMVFGKTPFAHSISPKKTFEGVLGAILFPCTAITLIFYFVGLYTDGEYAIKMPLFDYVLLSFVCSCLAILGDLCESFLKRCASQKDTGTIF